ncbi:MAG: hypothetical protein NTY66_03295 [Candidatus Vogelbacteria bacterium]|nr:hypothetical protein [Candidatus Vogelbacteria bacterium]
MKTFVIIAIVIVLAIGGYFFLANRGPAEIYRDQPATSTDQVIGSSSPSGSVNGSFRDKCLAYNSVRAQVNAQYGVPGEGKTELTTYRGVAVCHLAISINGMTQDQYFTEEALGSSFKQGQLWVVTVAGKGMTIEQYIENGKPVKVTCTPASSACSALEKMYSGQFPAGVK